MLSLTMRITLRPIVSVVTTMMVRAGVDMVRLYSSNYQLVASHPRAKEAGARITNPVHLPPTHLEGLVMTREMCLEAATEIGQATLETTQAILADTAVDRLPTARRLLRLRESFGDLRLEAACDRANRFGDPSYSTVKRILVNELDGSAEPTEAATAPPAGQFVRKASDILGKWAEVLQWN